jgi:hypothetical protein
MNEKLDSTYNQNDSWLITDEYNIKPSRTIEMHKKLLDSLLHSHFALAFWFNWTEIEDIKLEGDKVKIVYKERINNE